MKMRYSAFSGQQQQATPQRTLSASASPRMLNLSILSTASPGTPVPSFFSK